MYSWGFSYTRMMREGLFSVVGPKCLLLWIGISIPNSGKFSVMIVFKYLRAFKSRSSPFLCLAPTCLFSILEFPLVLSYFYSFPYFIIQVPTLFPSPEILSSSQSFCAETFHTALHLPHYASYFQQFFRLFFSNISILVEFLFHILHYSSYFTYSGCSFRSLLSFFSFL